MKTRPNVLETEPVSNEYAYLSVILAFLVQYVTITVLTFASKTDRIVMSNFYVCKQRVIKKRKSIDKII